MDWVVHCGSDRMDCQVQILRTRIMADDTATETMPATAQGSREPASGSSRPPRSSCTNEPWPVSASTRSAGRPGTSKSQLYHYFDDKDDLVHAVIDHQRERVLGFHRPALESLSSWDDIQRWRDMVVEAQAGHACRGGCPLGSLANELADLDEPARTRLSDAFMAWERLLSDGLAKMVEVGSLRGDADAKDLALSVHR